MSCCILSLFFKDTATTAIYTLSLHDALPISHKCAPRDGLDVRGNQREIFHVVQVQVPDRTGPGVGHAGSGAAGPGGGTDRKSTRLNSSHGYISYAVFCLKKKKILIELRMHVV